MAEKKYERKVVEFGTEPAMKGVSLSQFTTDELDKSYKDWKVVGFACKGPGYVILLEREITAPPSTAIPQEEDVGNIGD